MKTRQLLSKTFFVTTFCIASLLTGSALHAQVKIGNNSATINSAAILEIESTNKGILLPRVALTATNAAGPLSAHVAGMTVYNTASAGSVPFNVTPGVYFNDGNKWAKISPVESDLTYITTTNPTQLTSNAAPWQDFRFQTEASDVLNEYNPATGKFTAARGGLYTMTFNAFCFCPNAPFEATLQIDINNEQYPGATYKSQSSAYFSSSVTIPMKLSAGDVVYPRMNATVNGCTIASNTNLTFMTIMQVR